ncbi:VOC family protein [Nocardioides sp. B-3]|nr:VOC family protein [Nocardioides sp. B-3]UUZ61690.1 VOC family protein [Nocardioides sp. B-3]
MALTIQSLIIDCHDPSTLASFWEAALGWRRTFEKADEVVLEPPEHSLQDGVAPDLLFGLSPDGKVGKNRLHLDLRPDVRAVEVERLLGPGASLADVGRGDDVTWVVMTDPEGNEFCVLRPFNEDELAQLEAIRAARRQ